MNLRHQNRQVYPPGYKPELDIQPVKKVSLLKRVDQWLDQNEYLPLQVVHYFTAPLLVFFMGFAATLFYVAFWAMYTAFLFSPDKAGVGGAMIIAFYVMWKIVKSFIGLGDAPFYFWLIGLIPAGAVLVSHPSAESVHTAKIAMMIGLTVYGLLSARWYGRRKKREDAAIANFETVIARLYPDQNRRRWHIREITFSRLVTLFEKPPALSEVEKRA